MGGAALTSAPRRRRDPHLRLPPAALRAPIPPFRLGGARTSIVEVPQLAVNKGIDAMRNGIFALAIAPILIAAQVSSAHQFTDADIHGPYIFHAEGVQDGSGEVGMLALLCFDGKGGVSVCGSGPDNFVHFGSGFPACPSAVIEGGFYFVEGPPVAPGGGFVLNLPLDCAGGGSIFLSFFGVFHLDASSAELLLQNAGSPSESLLPSAFRGRLEKQRGDED